MNMKPKRGQTVRLDSEKSNLPLLPGSGLAMADF